MAAVDITCSSNVGLTNEPIMMRTNCAECIVKKRKDNEQATQAHVPGQSTAV